MITQVLILAWRCPHNGKWIPVGKLLQDRGKYVFDYTVGAHEAEREEAFMPFATMGDLNVTYESEELFPVFCNRLLQKNRPEYDDYVGWLGFDKNKFSPLEELARSGGIRVTDNLQLFSIPQKNGNLYEFHFFSHGIRHLPPCYIDRINHLNHGNKLFLMKDVQNNFDPFALALRTGDPPEIVGYTPRFLSQDFTELLHLNGNDNVFVQVEKINLKAPLQFKLLCKISTTWPDAFTPFNHDAFKTKKEMTRV